MLATIGAFRVVRERDLENFRDVEVSLEHLRDQGLIHSVQIGADERADVLTDLRASLVHGLTPVHP